MSSRVGHTEDFDGEFGSIRIQPHGNGSGTTGFIDCFKFSLWRDFSATEMTSPSFTSREGMLTFLPLSLTVVMDDQLSCFRSGICKPCSINDVVQSAFQQTKQVFTSHAGFSLSHFKIMSELASPKRRNNVLRSVSL